MQHQRIPIEKYRRLITMECDAVKELLIAKNKEYGASAFHPIRVFSQASAQEQIDVRIDDKLKRIRAIHDLDEVRVHEDTELDLIGYLVLRRVARRLENKDDAGQI
jgi:hypothetical protein